MTMQHQALDYMKIQTNLNLDVQGDTISPKLFTLTLESIFKKLDWSSMDNINGRYLNHLRFADDISPDSVKHGTVGNNAN